MSFAIKSGKSGPKRVPTQPERTRFVLGSRPPDLRAPAPGRIKPMAGKTMYGKQPPMTPGFNQTGQTGES